MNYKEVIKEVKKHSWWTEEMQGVIQTLHYPLHSFITQCRVFHPRLLTITIIGFFDDVCFELTPEDEKYKVYHYIFNKIKKGDKYLLNKKKESLKFINKVFQEYEYFRKNKGRMNNKGLWKSYDAFIENYLHYLEYGVGIECVDIFTDSHLIGMLRKELKIGSKQVMDIAITLSAPLKLSFMELERKDFLNLCVDNYDDIRNNHRNNGIKKQLEQHSKRFYYILNNFIKTQVLNPDFFLSKAIEETKSKNKRMLINELKGLESKINRLKKKKSNIYKQYKISKELKIHFNIIELMAEWIDERKKNLIITTHYILEFCNEISKRYDIGISYIVNYYVDDLKELLLNNKMVDKKELNRRKSCSINILTKNRKDRKIVSRRTFYGKKASLILNECIGKKDEIKGYVASAPVVKLKGKVQVIADVSKNEFKEGNILVTTMTRPEFVPLMRMASAIITDEGGLTCHAAIVSRELGIPCIIGTRNATKLLKSGMNVEIDTNTGRVKILKNMSTYAR